MPTNAWLGIYAFTIGITLILGSIVDALSEERESEWYWRLFYVATSFFGGGLLTFSLVILLMRIYGLQ